MSLPGTPTRRRTSKPLLNLHWDVLPPAKIERTVWARTASSSGVMEGVDDAEVQELEKLFSKKSPAKIPAIGRRPSPGGILGGRLSRTVASGGGPGGGRARAGMREGKGSLTVGEMRVKKVHLLEGSRGNNVAIGLKAFRRLGGLPELAGLVGNLDPEGAYVKRVCPSASLGPRVKGIFSLWYGEIRMYHYFNTLSKNTCFLYSRF